MNSRYSTESQTGLRIRHRCGFILVPHEGLNFERIEVMIRAEYSGRPCLGDPLLPIQLSSLTPKRLQKRGYGRESSLGGSRSTKLTPAIRSKPRFADIHKSCTAGFNFSLRLTHGSRLALLTNEEDASLSRDALGNMPFATLLK